MREFNPQRRASAIRDEVLGGGKHNFNTRSLTPQMTRELTAWTKVALAYTPEGHYQVTHAEAHGMLFVVPRRIHRLDPNESGS